MRIQIEYMSFKIISWWVVAKISKCTGCIPEQYLVFPSWLYSNSSCSQACLLHSLVLSRLPPDLLLLTDLLPALQVTFEGHWISPVSSTLRPPWESVPTTPTHLQCPPDPPSGSQCLPVTTIHFADALYTQCQVNCTLQNQVSSIWFCSKPGFEGPQCQKNIIRWLLCHTESSIVVKPKQSSFVNSMRFYIPCSKYLSSGLTIITQTAGRAEV